MKRFQKTKKSNKRWLLVALTAIAIGLGVFLYVNKNSDNTRSMNDIKYSEATEEEKQAVEEHKKEVAQDQEKDKDPTPKPVTIDLAITRAQQTSAGQPLNIRTLISGATAGECKVTLTKNGQSTITRTFAVIFEATSARCHSADIPVSEFSTGGEWQLSVIVTNSGQQSNVVERTVTITK